MEGPRSRDQGCDDGFRDLRELKLRGLPASQRVRNLG